jgi:hypothetical protein
MNEIAMNALLARALPLVVFLVVFAISSLSTYRLFFPRRRHEWTVEEILEREG